MKSFIELNSTDGKVAILASEIKWISELPSDFHGNSKTFVATGPENRGSTNGWFVEEEYGVVKRMVDRALTEMMM